MPLYAAALRPVTARWPLWEHRKERQGCVLTEGRAGANDDRTSNAGVPRSYFRLSRQECGSDCGSFVRSDEVDGSAGQHDRCQGC